MIKTLYLSASARVEICALAKGNPGMHMLAINGIENAIHDRLKPIIEVAGRSVLNGARIGYTACGISANLVVKSRSVDLIDIRFEPIRPRPRTVDVVMSDDGARRIAGAIAEAKAIEARRAYLDLNIGSRRCPFVPVRSAA